MGLGGVLDSQAAEEKLVRLGILVGLLDGVSHVVFLGEEAPGSQDDDRQAVILARHPAEVFRGEFRHAVDVARLERL